MVNVKTTLFGIVNSIAHLANVVIAFYCLLALFVPFWTVKEMFVTTSGPDRVIFANSILAHPSAFAGIVTKGFLPFFKLVSSSPNQLTTLVAGNLNTLPARMIFAGWAMNSLPFSSALPVAKLILVSLYSGLTANKLFAALVARNGNEFVTPFPKGTFFWMFALPFDVVFFAAKVLFVVLRNTAQTLKLFATMIAGHRQSSFLGAPGLMMFSTAKVMFVILYCALCAGKDFAAIITSKRDTFVVFPSKMLLHMLAHPLPVAGATTKVILGVLQFRTRSRVGLTAVIADGFNAANAAFPIGGVLRTLAYPFVMMFFAAKMKVVPLYLVGIAHNFFATKGTMNLDLCNSTSFTPKKRMVFTTKVMLRFRTSGNRKGLLAIFADVLKRHFTLPTRVPTFLEDWQGRCRCPACSGRLARPTLATNNYITKGGLWQAVVA